MFLNPNFSFNGKYSKDMNVSICSLNQDLINKIGINYASNITLENELNKYNPFYSETFSQPETIELNLLLYDSNTMQPLEKGDYDIEELYDWLITDYFAPFISDDDTDMIYYFKVVNISKMLTYEGRGYLVVTFQPYTKYCYKRVVQELSIASQASIEIYNPSREAYKPIIEITNRGDEKTVIKINDMEITELAKYETVTIDNLTKIIVNEKNENKYANCNRKWIELEPRKNNVLNLDGVCAIKIICEFPLLR